MATRIASPKAASQAPKDKRRKIRNGLFRCVRQWVIRVKAVKVNRRLSVARRTIRRCVRWEINRIIHIIIGRGVRATMGVNMAGGL